MVDRASGLLMWSTALEYRPYFRRHSSIDPVVQSRSASSSATSAWTPPAKMARMARLYTAEPGAVRTVHGSHKEVIPEADNPDDPRRLQRPVAPPRRDAELVSRSDIG